MSCNSPSNLFLSHQASEEAKQFVLLSVESEKYQCCIEVIATSVDMGQG